MYRQVREVKSDRTGPVPNGIVECVRQVDQWAKRFVPQQPVLVPWATERQIVENDAAVVIHERVPERVEVNQDPKEGNQGAVQERTREQASATTPVRILPSHLKSLIVTWRLYL